MAQTRNPDGTFGRSDKDIKKQDVDRAINMFFSDEPLEVAVTRPMKIKMDVQPVTADVHVHNDDSPIEDIFLKAAISTLAIVATIFIIGWMIMRW